MSSQFDMFKEPDGPSNDSPTNGPMAHRHRPNNINEYQGYQELIKRYPFLIKPGTRHFILWGPPGSGKTTLVHLLSKIKEQQLHTLNAVLQGVPDLKKLLKTIRSNESLFIDEIHRFNKAQQDALLPSLEKGDFTFYGATTENPFVSLNPALRSRVTIIQLENPSEEMVRKALLTIKEKEAIDLKEKTIHFLASQSQGDMRLAINLLEIAQGIGDDQTKLSETFRKMNLSNSDSVERYYDLISALIKSMRGSDPNSALLYLASLIQEGHDLVAVCRRLMIFASEDVGNADPHALSLATDCLTAFQNVGLPEGRIILGQTVSYLASTHKSNRAYMAINHALKYVEENGETEIPKHLKNKKDSNYLYPHNYPMSYVKQDYSIDDLPNFYEPSELGREGQFKNRLENLK